MDPKKLSIKIGFKVLSDVNGIMTIVLYTGNKILHIFAGDSYKILHVIENWGRSSGNDFK
jgi:hypothetical protein